MSLAVSGTRRVGIDRLKDIHSVEPAVAHPGFFDVSLAHARFLLDLFCLLPPDSTPVLLRTSSRVRTMHGTVAQIATTATTHHA